MKNRNGELDILRFLFSINIVLSHMAVDMNSIVRKTYCPFGVEFFFLCSGFFLARHAMIMTDIKTNDELGRETWKYTIKKASRIWKYYIIVILIYAILRFIGDNSIGRMIKDFLDSVPMYFFINQPLHLIPSLYLRGSWYISAMLVVSFIYYYMILRFKKPFIEVVLPFCSLFIVGYLIQKNNNGSIFTFVHDNGLLINLGLLRAFAVMGIGAFIFTVSLYVNENVIIFSKGKVLLLCVKYIAYIIALLLCFNYINATSYYTQIFMIFCIGFLILSLDSVPKIRGGVVTDYLGKISLLYYLTHGVTIYLISKYAQINSESILIMSVIIGNFVLSNIIMFFCDFIFGFTKKHTDKVATIRFK